MNKLKMKGDIKFVCINLEAVAKHFKGWTVKKYLDFLELQRIQNEQFKEIFEKEEKQ